MDDTTKPATEVEETSSEVEVEEDDFDAFEAKVEEQAEEPEEIDEDPVEQEPAESDDEAEIEYEGAKYRVPKPLKDAFMREADYTQKTQALSETRKQVEATLEALQTVSEGQTNALAQVAVIESRLSQYNNIDWELWQSQDPIAALTARQEMMDLRQARQDAVNGYTQAQAQAHSIAQREIATRLEQGHKVLAEKIPGWNGEKAKAIRDFALTTYGFPPEVIDSVDEPLAILVLHDAMEGRKIREQAEKKAKLEQRQAVKPVPTLKGNGGRPAISPDTTDFAAFEKLASRSAR